MRCGCPHCGIYMVQREQGLKSACICPNCLFSCAACMGTLQEPIAADKLKANALLRERMEQMETRYDDQYE